MAICFDDGICLKFSGKGLVDKEFLAVPDCLSSVALGTVSPSVLVKQTGFPGSTTHAFVGLVAGGFVGAFGFPGGAVE
ncbi:MAG: hypothetical protein JNL67_13620 [Planctomycetaceae bacterium]|nr:hypothetical protein [Planctomycetaceae bacterium]